MKLQEIINKTLERMKTFKIEGVLPALRALNQGALEDVYNINGCAYYQFSTCLVEIMKPLQVVELGGAMGVWDLMVLHSLTPEAQLYSITLPENGLEFSYIVDKYPNFTGIVGNDLEINNWNKVELGKTDLWFIDTSHNRSQLIKELKLYQPYFRKGSLVMLDDIHINDGMNNVWGDIRAGKYGFSEVKDITDPLHYTGFGLILV